MPLHATGRRPMGPAWKQATHALCRQNVQPEAKAWWWVPRRSGAPRGEHTLADNRVGTRARTLQLYKASAQRGLDRLAPAGSTRSQTTAWVHRAPPAFLVGIGTARAPSGLTSPTVTCHRYYPLCLHFSLRCYSPEGGKPVHSSLSPAWRLACRQRLLSSRDSHAASLTILLS